MKINRKIGFFVRIIKPEVVKKKKQYKGKKVDAELKIMSETDLI